MSLAARRTRKCKRCKQPFSPWSSTQKLCSFECANAQAVTANEKRAKAQAQAQAKADRAALRAQREALKSRAQYLREAQAAANAYARERDKDLPCISCGRYHEGAWDAGHYLSVGSHPELRFHEDNIHRQCVPCNRHKGGNALMYRKGLIARRGLEVVEWLEGPHEAQKYTIEDARRIKAEYQTKLRLLKAGAHD